MAYSAMTDKATGDLITEAEWDKIKANFDAAYPVIAPDVAWTSFTPTYTNMTVGNGTTTARYFKHGRWVVFEIKFVFGSTSAMSTNPTYTLPVTAASRYTADLDTYGVCNILDSGTANFIGPSFVSSTTVGKLQVGNSGTASLQASGFTSTLPMTWTTNDGFTVKGWYEAAA